MNIEEITFADVESATAHNLKGDLKAKFENARGFVRHHLDTALLNEYNPNLLGCARILEKNGFTQDEAVEIIHAAPGHRAPEGDEIEKAVCTVFNTERKADSIRWPDASRDAIDRVVKNCPVKSVSELQAKFPMEGNGETFDVLRRLFEQHERIAYAERPGAVKPESALLGDIENLERMQMICPNPRSKEWGLKRDGKKSRRAVGNDPEQRRYLVVEIDRVDGEKLPFDTQAAIAWHLSKIAPLVLIVHSGGKSLHCWFDCRGLSDGELLKFMKYARLLGADKQMWKKSQWCRMPGGVRVKDDGKTAPQKVLVCRPEEAKSDDWHWDKLPTKKRVFPRVMTSEQMQHEYSAPPVEVLCGALARGEKLQISGSSKAGKTWALLNLAEAVSSGGKFFGIQCIKGKVLYLNFELGETRMRERIDLFSGLHGVDFLNFRGIACDWDFIKTGLATVEGDYSIFIIDPIYKMLGDNDENSNGDIARLLHHIEEIATEHCTAIAYSHHFSKGNKSKVESIDRASGAGAWGRDPDALFSLTAHEQADCLTFESILRNYKAIPKSVWKVNFPRFEHLPDADPEALKSHGGNNKRGSARDAAMVVTQYPDGISKSDLVQKLMSLKNVSKPTAYRYIANAEKAGAIELTDGKYHAPGGDCGKLL